MNDSKTIERAKRAEAELAAQPILYKLRLLGFASLGYIYLAVVVVLLLCLALFITILGLALHVILIGAIVCGCFAPIGAILSSLWIKIDAPKGHLVTHKEAPELLDLVEQTRAATNAPRFHQVLLVSDYNCAVSTIPMFGLFGPYRHYLLLGLPMMESLSPSEFRGVLAHEMGHVSRNHGFTTTLCYAIRVTWLKIFLSLHAQRGQGISNNSWVVKRFVEWYLPTFDSFAMPLSRMQEKEADRLAATIAGPKSCRNGLLKIAVKSVQLDKFWEDVTKQMPDVAKPPQNIFASMSEALAAPPESEVCAQALKRRWKEHDPFDSHPSDPERLTEFDPSRNWFELETVVDYAEWLASKEQVGETAATQYLAKALPKMRQLLSDEWDQGVETTWTMRFKACDEARRKIAKLEEAHRAGDLPIEQAEELAQLYEQVLPADDAIAALKALNGDFPERGKILTALGFLLLEKKSPAAISLLERAMHLDDACGLICCAALAAHFAELQDNDQAEIYRHRADKFAKLYAEAMKSAKVVHPNDVFLPHTIPHDDLADLAALCATEKCIKQVFVTRKEVPEILGGHTHFVVVKFESTNIVPLPAEVKNKAYLSLLHSPVAGKLRLWLLPYEAIKTKNLKDACMQPGALVYDRRSHVTGLGIAWTPPVPIKESLFHRYKLPIVAAACMLGIVGLSIAAGISHRYKTNDAYMSALASHVRSHWMPPYSPHAGVSLVSFQVDKSGNFSDFKLAQSAGDLALDVAALQAVKAVSGFGQLPAETHFPARVEFGLRYVPQEHYANTPNEQGTDAEN